MGAAAGEPLRGTSQILAGSTAEPRKILFITGHSLREAARVSIHFMQLAAAEQGRRIVTLIAGRGPAQLWRDRGAPTRPTRILSDLGIEEISPITLFAPVDLRLAAANAFIRPLVGRYGGSMSPSLRRYAKSADLIVLESGAAVPFLRALDRDGLLGKTIYLAADDLRTIRGHPILQETLARYAKRLRACVSFGAHAGLDPFFDPDQVVVIAKGIDTKSLKISAPSPFEPGSINVASVGNMLIDPNILDFAGRISDVNFHFIGKMSPPTEAAHNVKLYGVLPFESTVPYLLHADAGLLPYRSAANDGYLKTSSLKLAQFKAIGLPIIGPDALEDDDPGYYAFRSGDFESFASAVRAAVRVQRPIERPGAGVDYRENWAEIERRFLP